MGTPPVAQLASSHFCSFTVSPSLIVSSSNSAPGDIHKTIIRGSVHMLFPPGHSTDGDGEDRGFSH